MEFKIDISDYNKIKYYSQDLLDKNNSGNYLWSYGDSLTLITLRNKL